MYLCKILKSKKTFFYLFIFVVFVIIIVLAIFYSNIGKKNDNIRFKEELIKKNEIGKNLIDKVLYKSVYSKVIIVGDSRMELIEKDKKNLDIPVNYSFIALSGSKIDWLEKFAIKDLKKYLDNADSHYKYHVVFNMGVNDFEFCDNVYLKAKEYFNIYKNVALKYKNINFYLLSVNPVDEKKIFDSYRCVGRTDKKVRDFNNELKKLLARDTLKNIFYCDSYSNIKFDSPDGLHYDEKTNQNIINFISRKCLNI